MSIGPEDFEVGRCIHTTAFITNYGTYARLLQAQLLSRAAILGYTQEQHEILHNADRYAQYTCSIGSRGEVLALFAAAIMSSTTSTCQHLCDNLTRPQQQPITELLMLASLQLQYVGGSEALLSSRCV